MSDPTPFTDPLDAEGVDPDLSKDRDDEREQSPGANVDSPNAVRTDTTSPDATSPDDRVPTHEEQQRDAAAAEEQGHEGDGYAHIP